MSEQMVTKNVPPMAFTGFLFKRTHPDVLRAVPDLNSWESFGVASIGFMMLGLAALLAQTPLKGPFTLILAFVGILLMSTSGLLWAAWLAWRAKTVHVGIWVIHGLFGPFAGLIGWFVLWSYKGEMRRQGMDPEDVIALLPQNRKADA